MGVHLKLMQVEAVSMQMHDDIVWSIWKHIAASKVADNRVASIIEHIRRDEYTHHLGNSHLFRQYITENPDIWDDELKFDIYESMREIVAYEDALIDYLNPKEKDKFKTYVRYQANSALLELGMKANWEQALVNPFEFMSLITGTVITDFFSGKVTQYSKKMLGSREDLRAKLQHMKDLRNGK